MYERPLYLPEMPVQRRPEDFVPGGLKSYQSQPSPEAPHAAPAQQPSPPLTERPQRKRSAAGSERVAKTDREPSLRVTLTGRLGTEVTVRQTPKGQELGRFSLAIPTENGKARYETILVFGQRVNAVQELHKGDAVEVIGYPHEREITGRDGGKKVRREVYATVVRPR
jgi:hypothetical protein